MRIGGELRFPEAMELRFSQICAIFLREADR